jgi:tRNA (mo5U34)-methyltransferase
MHDRVFFESLLRHPLSSDKRKLFRQRARGLPLRRSAEANAANKPLGSKAAVLQERVDRYYWWHSIDLGDGVVTCGHKTLEVMRFESEVLFSAVDLRNKSILDVGAWNGGFSLEAARRGASRIVGLDHATWNDPHFHGRETYDLVAQVTGNHFEAIDLDLDASGLSLSHLGRFDVVLYAGVFYHLFDPIAVTRELTALARESFVMETHIEDISDKRPAMVFYPSDELNKDSSNWWGPNTACVCALLRHLGFPRIQVSGGSTPHRRVFHAFRADGAGGGCPKSGRHGVTAALRRRACIGN